MGKYSDLNNEVMSLCRTDRDTIVALRQICWNLAYIADELAEANRINSKTIGEIVEDLEMHGVKPDPGFKAEVSAESDILNGSCFICGGEVDSEHVGGVIIDGDGHTYRACAKCKHRFSVMADRLVMPNSIYL